MEYFATLSPKNETLSTIRARLTEYNENTTSTAGIVHKADKLEALIQASRYRKTHPHAAALEDFKAHISFLGDGTLRAIGDAVLANWDRSKPRVTYILLIGRRAWLWEGDAVRLPRQGTGCRLYITWGELRKEAATEVGHANFISRSFEERVPVPGELAMRILMQRYAAGEGFSNRGMLVDRFLFISKEKQMSSEFVTIYLRCPSAVLENRLQARAQSSNRADDLDAENRTLRALAFEKDSEALLAELRGAPFWEVDGSDLEEKVAHSMGRCMMELKNSKKTWVVWSQWFFDISVGNILSL
ncbi:hypothetical protein PG985_005850 [Apiospora marii]|uniref:uncharacterized protein n=1 Tax=Apiospora marii TaxID=335849 RepID=UPI00312D2C2A